MARIDPLPPEHSPELAEQFASFFKSLGFVPNSVLTMQRNPKLVHAFVTLQGAIWGPDSKVDRGLKRLIAHVASRSAGDAYSMAHTASGALHFGVSPDKLAVVSGFAASPLFTPGGESGAGHRRMPQAARRMPSPTPCSRSCGRIGVRPRSSKSSPPSPPLGSSTAGTPPWPPR